jgi:AcrR family transcriptional regulator
MTEQLQRQRRRGEELENALLEAAWEEIAEAGFGKLTMESVAARAKTGVAVLYRRWPNKHDLVIAAIRHYGDTHPVRRPDTGSLRGDMIALLTSVSDQRQPFTAVVTATFAGLLADTGLTPAEVRLQIMRDRPFWSADLFQRAAVRGEINLEATPPAVLTMPFDLMRHDMLLTLKPVPPERVAAIVDDLFMPLVAAYRGEPGR